MEVADGPGRLVMALDAPTWAGPVPSFSVTFPGPGEHVIRILHAGEGKPGGRLARCIYVVSRTAGHLPVDAWARAPGPAP